MTTTKEEFQKALDSAGVMRLLVEACEAALEYDKSIVGQAARGEVDITKEGVAIANTNVKNLDKLYLNWQTKSASALEAYRSWWDKKN